VQKVSHLRTIINFTLMNI